MARNDIAVNPLGFFGEPLDEARAIEDLALGLGQRFAHFGGQDGTQIVGIGNHQVIELAQHGAAFLAGFLGPVLLRNIGRINRGSGFLDTEIRQRSDDLTGRRIEYVEGLAAWCVFHPGAADIGRSHTKARVF